MIHPRVCSNQGIARMDFLRIAVRCTRTAREFIAPRTSQKRWRINHYRATCRLWESGDLHLRNVLLRFYFNRVSKGTSSSKLSFRAVITGRSDDETCSEEAILFCWPRSQEYCLGALCGYSSCADIDYMPSEYLRIIDVSCQHPIF